jgi:hypothetical protein
MTLRVLKCGAGGRRSRGVRVKKERNNINKYNKNKKA